MSAPIRLATGNSEGPETRDSLLLQLGEPEQTVAWEEFVAIYRPVIYRMARRRGMQDSDAEDLTQRVLVSISNAISNWKRDDSKQGFRAWLSTVTRNAIINAVTRSPKEWVLGGSGFQNLCDDLPDESDELEQTIEHEHRRSRFRLAAERVRGQFEESTWKAFWMTAVEGVSVEQAANELGLSAGSIYGARARVMNRLKSCVTESQVCSSGGNG